MEERPRPAHCGDNMDTRSITFTADVDEYKAGDTYTLPRALARHHIREGNAVRAEPKATPKKKYKKKVVRERTTNEPNREQATDS